MLRVATNVKTLEGERAIGTYIPAEMPSGDRDKVEANPVISTVLRGERYEGTALVLNDYYLTAYEPIQDASGKIVGMLYVGVPQRRGLAQHGDPGDRRRQDRLRMGPRRFRRRPDTVEEGK